MKTLSIHGAGFVGSAAYEAFWPLGGPWNHYMAEFRGKSFEIRERAAKWHIAVYDKDEENCLLRKNNPIIPALTGSNVYFSSEEHALQSELHFVCVPTPMREDGSCFTGIVESVISNIAKHNKDCDIVIKSTVPPGFTKKMSKIHERVFFNPEFLTEANYLEDFKSLPYQFIGSPNGLKSELLEQLYKDAFALAEPNKVHGGNMILRCDSSEAEMVKLTRNCYLATRLSFFNEIKQICDKLEVDYDNVRIKAGMDDRVGSHYSKVPGPDGKLGFGGSCLCKDINDLMTVANDLGVDPKTLKGVWDKNLEVRPERDWEQLSGRAVVKK